MKAPFERFWSLGALVACLASAHACARPGPPGDEVRPVEVRAEAARASAPPGAFHRGVGAVISGDDALRWARRWVERHPEGTRSVYFGREAFEAVLRRAGAEGVSMQLAINDAGDTTLVLVPLDREGQRLPDDMSLATMTNDDDSFFAVDSGLVCPTNCPDTPPADGESDAAPLHRGVGAPIPGATARRWARAYQRRHPGGLRSVFFGRDVLERVLAQPGCEGVSIHRAIDDAGGELLALFPLDSEARHLPGEAASDAAGEAGPLAFDNAVTCPPCCPSEN
ncbi:MAG TPA: hypothetical protein VFS43_26515 [Polyangiaceae bacterium]|nr:hypothetical protein [Polyangiaceae bacterium]